MDAVKLNLTELVTQYIDFLVRAKGATLNELADFFSFASRLLLRKVDSLFPDRAPAPDEIAPEEDDFVSEEELAFIMNRYRPVQGCGALARRGEG